MKKILLLITIFTVYFGSWSLAQQSDCSFRLQEAENMYESGILDSIPSLLRNCINNDGFDDEELSRAYKLLILTYLFEDYQEMAELTMLKFLKKFPEYEFRATDAVEFKYLYNSYQTIPTFSLGILVGGNYSMPRVIQPFSVTDTEDYNGEYSAGFYFQAGAQFKKYITDEIEINLDILYTGKTFDYTIEQLNTYTTKYTENIQMLSFPLTGTYDFRFGNWSPYGRVGVNLDYILSAKADFTLQENRIDIRKDTDYEITDDRNPINISAIIGGGIKFHFKMGYVMADLRYHYNFSNTVNGENRDNNFKTGGYYYRDDDFTINNFYFSFGYVHPFYKTKQNK